MGEDRSTRRNVRASELIFAISHEMNASAAKLASPSFTPHLQTTNTNPPPPSRLATLTGLGALAPIIVLPRVRAAARRRRDAVAGGGERGGRALRCPLRRR